MLDFLSLNFLLAQSVFELLELYWCGVEDLQTLKFEEAMTICMCVYIYIDILVSFHPN